MSLNVAFTEAYICYTSRFLFACTLLASHLVDHSLIPSQVWHPHKFTCQTFFSCPSSAFNDGWICERFRFPVLFLKSHSAQYRELCAYLADLCDELPSDNKNRALCTSVAHNFSQIFAIRWFLGIFESAILPSVVFYLSTFYKRNELASRIGLFYGNNVSLASSAALNLRKAAASISGAFSGLLLRVFLRLETS